MKPAPQQARSKFGGMQRTAALLHLQLVPARVLARRLVHGLAALVVIVAVLVAEPAVAAITYVASSTNGASGKVSSIAVSLPAGLIANDVMLASISQRGGNSPIVGTAPSGWIKVLEIDDGTADGLAIYSKVATASEPASYTWVLNNSERTAAAIVAFRGVDTVGPVNASASQANAASTSYTATSVTTTVANAMLVAFYSAIDGNGTINASTGMTQAFTAATGAGPNGVVIGSSYATQGSAGASGTKVSASNTSLANLGALVALKPALNQVEHYELSLPSNSLNCLPTTVSVTACSNSSSPCTSNATTLSGQSATLSTSGATLGASSVTFNASGVASTSLSYPSATNGTAVSVTLSGEQTAASNPRQCCPNGTACSVANACSTTFNTAGLVFSSTAGGAVATLPVQTAGTASSTYFLRAVQSNTTTAACSAALTGANSVSMAYQCNNPTSCSASNSMSVNGGSATTIQRNNSASSLSYTPVVMTFDANGNAPFNFTFADVGQTTLWATKTVNSAVLSGSSNAFVTRPAGFAVSAVAQTASPNLANPAAASATGAKFIKAGESFAATVTAQTSTGVATPNFGKETVPEGVLLTQALVLPSGGATGTLANSTVAGGSFSNGVATVTNLAWSEVGIITLTPSLSSSSYLGTGNVTGTSTGNVGRFVPDHFALSAATVTNRATSSCSPASTFTYLGENFRLGFTLTAQNSAATTTQNYSGSFAKLDPTSASTWNLAGISGSTVFSGASGRLALGSATGTWGSGVTSGVTLTAAASRASSPDGPFANAVFGIAPVDSDGVAFASYDLDADPLVVGNDHLTLAGVALRFGRLQMQNVYGSELLDLPIPVQAQYWAGSYYTTNGNDSCTAIPVSSITMGNYLKQLSACKTQLSPTGTVTLVAGKLSGTGLLLTKPGANNAGSVDLAINLGTVPTGAVCLGTSASSATAANMPWFGANPGARAAFGVFKSPIIYGRENY